MSLFLKSALSRLFRISDIFLNIYLRDFDLYIPTPLKWRDITHCLKYYIIYRAQENS
jgi:hypothetical protein